MENTNTQVKIIKITPTWIKVTLSLFILLTSVSIFIAGYYYLQIVNTNNSKKIQNDSVDDIVKKVGKIMYLPEGEVPTLATVNDPSQLKNQPFFAKAKKGDQVLVYSLARKVILFDPIANKIIDIAPLDVNNQVK